MDAWKIREFNQRHTFFFLSFLGRSFRLPPQDVEGQDDFDAVRNCLPFLLAGGRAILLLLCLPKTSHGFLQRSRSHVHCRGRNTLR